MNRRFEGERGEMVGASVPDEDMPGWLNTLVEGGFSQEEIDKIMAHLNETYARQKGIKKATGHEIHKIMEEEYGRKLTDQEKEEVDQVMKEDFKKAAKELGINVDDVDF